MPNGIYPVPQRKPTRRPGGRPPGLLMRLRTRLRRRHPDEQLACGADPDRSAERAARHPAPIAGDPGSIRRRAREEAGGSARTGSIPIARLSGPR